jgi:signal transduction histidine kinase
MASGVAELPGVVTGNVDVYPGGRALISGRMFGNATNEGGQLDVNGRVVGNVTKTIGLTIVSSDADVTNDVSVALRETQRTLEDSRIETAVLEERQRIAREVHDTVAQGFTSILMHLEAPSSWSTATRRKPASTSTTRAAVAEGFRRGYLSL